MNAKQFSKVKVGDIIYWNGPGEAEVLVVSVSEHEIGVIKRCGGRQLVFASDGDTWTRKPEKHIVYYKFYADDAISNLTSTLVNTIMQITSTITLIEKATDNDN